MYMAMPAGRARTTLSLIQIRLIRKKLQTKMEIIERMH